MTDGQTVEFTLPGCEPGELLRGPTPAGVWVRVEDERLRTSAAEALITIRGPRLAVLAFVADNWGGETADQVEAECAVRGALPSEVFASPEHLERVAAKVVRALQDAALLGCAHRGQ